MIWQTVKKNSLQVVEESIRVWRSKLLWDFTQHRVGVSYLCFGTTYWSSSTVKQSMKSQRSTDLIYTTVEVRNFIHEICLLCLCILHCKINEPLKCSTRHFKQQVTAVCFLDMNFIKYTYWFTSQGRRHIKKNSVSQKHCMREQPTRQLLLALQHTHYNAHIHTVPVSQFGY
jgi:hypothetical protein